MILILIPIIIFVKKNKLINNKISELEKRINDLENKYFAILIDYEIKKPMDILKYIHWFFY